jgi:voltage-gated potassium channel
MDDRVVRFERAFAVPMLVAALLVIPVIVLEESNPGEPWDTVASIGNWVIWAAFLTEMVVMLSVARSRRAWLREHPLEVAIVVLTPPFLTSAFSAIRVLRLLRLLRLVRVAKLARRFFSIEGLRYVSLIAVLTVIGGGVAYDSIESKSLGDGVYWAFMTMTTAGSNLPVRADTTKLLAGALVAVGVCFVAVLTGAIAQRFVVVELRRSWRRSKKPSKTPTRTSSRNCARSPSGSAASRPR